MGCVKKTQIRPESQKSLRDGEIPIYTTSFLGIIEFANHAFLQLSGYASDELIGQPIESFLETTHGKFSNQNHDAPVSRCSGIIKTQNQATITVNITSISGGLTSLDGDVCNIVEVINMGDLTEDDWDFSQLLIDSFLQHTTDAFSATNLDGQLLYVNPAYEHLFGYTREELVGRIPLSIVPSQQAEYRMYLEVVIRGGNITNHSIERMTKDGRMLTLDLTLSPIKNRNGKVIGAAAVMRDITDKKKSDEIIRRSEKLRIAGELAAGVAHEIRNPLAVIQGFLQLLRKQIQHEYLDMTLSEVYNIDNIIQEFLLLAKPVASTFQCTDVNGLIERVVTVIQPFATLSGVQLELDLSLLPNVKADETQIKQVILNLVKNGIESMDHGGLISIHTRKHGVDRVMIEITDQGHGIPKSELAKLGEPFYTTKKKGNGLGLMMSFKIVEEHRGELTINSEEGVGTTAQIILPTATSWLLGEH